MKKVYEIIIHGRGGQGAKTTAEILAQAGLKAGKFVQAFPEFGPERSGAPLRTFVRIGEKFIRSHEPIVKPNIILILDDSLLNTFKVLQNIYLAELVIINTVKDEKMIRKELIGDDRFAQNFQGEIITIDATKISEKIIGQNRPNTVILGQFANRSNVVAIEDVIEAFEEKYIKRIGEELTLKNLKAIKIAGNK